MGENLNKKIAISQKGSWGNNMAIDMDRIRRKLDSYFDKKEFDQAERLINYWIIESKNANDNRAELALQNEYMGFCRKQGRRDDAIMHAERAYEIIKDLNLEKTVSGATILVNIATVYKAFDNPDVAMEYFGKARDVYNENLKEDDKLFAGLYNNMALAAVDMKQFDAAEDYYKKAIDIMSKNEDGELDEAISYLNYADLLYAKFKADASDDYSKYENKISEFVEKAYSLLNKETTPRDEYYRFVCEKSAPSFGFYGYFRYEQEIRKRSTI